MRKRSINTSITTYETAARPMSRTWPCNDLLSALGPCLYAVHTKDGLVKIGYTSNLGNRMRSYGGVCRLLAFRLGGTFPDERVLHGRLAYNLARGHEYYHPNPEVLAVVNEMRDELGMTHLTVDDLPEYGHTA